MNESIVYSYDQLASIVDRLSCLVKKHSIVTFTGDLGAGKTTLIKELLKQFGVRDTVQSPTFSYVNSYTNAAGQIFYHFDLYRIGSLQDFYMAGFEDYLYAPNSITFIEWPALIDSLLTRNVLTVHSDYVTAMARNITVSCHCCD
jgi:tRNA threonylcarbamoyladenosine biosynthesis protein TsaE